MWSWVSHLTSLWPSRFIHITRLVLPTSKCGDNSLMCQPLRECLPKHVVIAVIAVTVTDSSEEMRPKEHDLPKSRLQVGGGEEIYRVPWFCHPHPTGEETGLKFFLWLIWVYIERIDVQYINAGRTHAKYVVQAPSLYEWEKRGSVAEWHPKVTEPKHDGHRTQTWDLSLPYIAPSSTPHFSQLQCSKTKSTDSFQKRILEENEKLHMTGAQIDTRGNKDGPKL